MIKTTFAFTPSPDGLQVLESLGTTTTARYGVRWVCVQPGEKQPNEMPEISIPLDATSFTIEAPEGSAVEFLFAYVGPDGRCSPAHQTSFRVQREVVPLSPGIPTMKSVAVTVGLNVLTLPPEPKVEAKAACGTGCGCSEPEPPKFWVQVSRHPMIKEGSIGYIADIQPDGKSVTVVFQKSDLEGTGSSTRFDLRDTESTGEANPPYYAIVLVDTPQGRVQTSIDDFIKANQVPVDPGSLETTAV